MRPNIAGGVTLGMGRIIGDTAIVVILLGATLHLEGAGGAPVLSTLRGTGATLTSYVKYNSPAGEGNAPEKAYAAAFVLLMMVIALNALVTRLTSGVRGARGTPTGSSRGRGCPSGEADERREHQDQRLPDMRTRRIDHQAPIRRARR